jgi:hypothetical protein
MRCTARCIGATSSGCAANNQRGAVGEDSNH